MANIELHQALTDQAQRQIRQYDLDNNIRFLAKYTLDTEGDVMTFIFRTGMPGKFPNGEWGFTVIGDSGMHIIPDPDPLDHRTSFRYGELPRYDIKLGSLYGVMAPMTIYERKLRLNLMNGKEWEAYYINAVAKALPNYWKYLSYSVFKGKHNKTKARLRDYISKYIEAPDGNTNGYKFYLSDGYGEINLKKVIAKQKVKEHALKKKLEEINKIIYKEQNKVEAQLADYVQNKQFIGQNFTAETQQCLAVYYKVIDELDKILTEGYFDPKYKVDSTKFEGYNAKVDAEDLILVLNRTDWIKMQRDFNFYMAGKAEFGIGEFRGVNVLFNDDMDRSTAVLMHRNLLQFWVMPSETRFLRVPYPREETYDLIYEARHTLDVVPIYCSMWFEYKAN